MTLTITRQMLAAEVLKLRRNRALMGFSFALSVVVVVLFFGYQAFQHATSPSQNGAAGGLHGFSDAVRMLGLYFGALVAILIGTEAGTADTSNGVYRDLVATGRSRLSLFYVRAPAAILVTLAFTGLAFLITLPATFVFAGPLPTPSVSLILRSAAWIVLCNAVLASLAVGVGALTGSRGVTLTGVIGWHTVATQLLLHVSSLGSLRDGLLVASLSRLTPVPGATVLAMSTGAAIAVVIPWLVIPAALGAWRTATRDA
jgi:hypothetical protein